MIYKLAAPFKTGQAGKLKIKNGTCQTDDAKLVAELTAPPHDFKLLEQVDELAEADGKPQGKASDKE